MSEAEGTRRCYECWILRYYELQKDRMIIHFFQTEKYMNLTAGVLKAVGTYE